MAVIDVGAGATDRASSFGTGYTYVDYNNPANGTGSLDTFEIYAYGTNLTETKIGTFSGSGTSWAMRDYESIGTVTKGSKQTFTGKSCSVSTGDILGIYFTGNGYLEKDSTGYAGIGRVLGDMFSDNDAHTYTTLADDALSLYATGETAAVGSLLTNLFKKPFRHMLIR